MIELLDVGDKVELGRYRLHCRFRQALVFALESPGESRLPLACVVEENKGRGPVNVGVGSLSAIGSDSMEVGPSRLVLGETVLDIENRYDSSLGRAAANPESFERNLRAFERVLLESSSKMSLACLLDEGRRRNFTSPFEKEFLRSISSGVERFLSGELEEGALAIKGLGFGLTPSGDDFLAGFLLGLHDLQAGSGANLSAEISAVSRVAGSENPIARQFLLCAAQGRFFERAKTLVLSLLAGEATTAAGDARRLLEMGESSGADLATGLLLALKSYRPWKAPAGPGPAVLN